MSGHKLHFIETLSDREVAAVGDYFRGFRGRPIDLRAFMLDGEDSAAGTGPARLSTERGYNAMSDLAERRLKTVRDHMRLECECDWDAVIATFEHPRYEMYGSGTVFDGEEAVRGYFKASRTPFPDQGNEIIAIAHAGDTVLVEFWLTGTHLGPLKVGDKVIEPTGKPFRARMAASFEFPPGGDRIVCERPYFDPSQIAQALGLG